MNIDMQNINPRQIAIRLKTFLSSSDLTDSQTARSLYANFLQLNNLLSSRMIHCSTLLQNQQKIDAVTLAQQEPALNTLFDTVTFPERKLLLRLAALYGWELPAELNTALMADINKAIAEMNDLRPLLAEFRRIARSNQLENKLRLLREITRRDKNNQEWELPLREVENQYLTKLIDQAQQAIISKRYSEVTAIYDELKNSTWVVSIPTVVMQKLNKVVNDYRLEMRKKRAVELLNEVNNALATFDVNALEDAIFCYNDHCSSSGYEPEKNELIQMREAEKFLDEEKKKQKILQDFHKGIASLNQLLDGNAPLTEIDKVFSAIKSTEHEIPLYLTNRVEQYREDVERDIRIRSILKVCRIVACSAVVIVVVVGGAKWITQTISENRLVNSIREKINQKDLPGATRMLADIDQKYPGLAKGAKITAVRADIAKLEAEDKARQETLAKLLADIDALKKVWPPDLSIAGKLAEISALAQSDTEKQQYSAIKQWYDDATARYSAECEDKFHARLATLKEMRNRIIGSIEEQNFIRAEKELLQLKNLIDEIRKMKFLKPELLSENNDLLSCAFALDDMLSTHRAAQAEQDEALRGMSTAFSLADLDEALRSYISIFQKNHNGKTPEQFILLKNDVDALKAIFNSQESNTTSSTANAYLRDIQQIKHDRELAEKACADLRKSFDRLIKSINHQRLSFIRFKDRSNRNIDFLVTRKISGIDGSLHLTRDDGTNVTIHPNPSYPSKYQIIVGDKVENEKTYSMCTLVYPANLSVPAVRQTVAAHQELIKKISQELPTITPDNVVSKGVEYLKMILNDQYCVEYWKMQLASRILQAIAPLDTSLLKSLQHLQSELASLKDLDTGDAQVYNEFLTQKIRDFLASYNVSHLVAAGRQIEFNSSMFQTLAKTKYQFFGIAVEENGKVKFSIAPALQNKTCDLLCFDDSSNQCLLVGRYSSNGVIIDEKFRSKVVNRLLFTTSPCGNMRAQTQTFKDNKDKFPVIKWPEFWPQNLKGDE